ncbi:MAG: PIG-L family deacetylase [Comamonadaceae bacterium]|nr:MAG: PIG-L family deacetylase [Comamonadaceae bacterium]
MDRLIVTGRGTTELAWMASAALRDAPAITADQLIPAGCRAVVVAPHPDDEVLAVGGLMAQLARIGRPLCVVAVTDGTASHPGSPHWTPARLGAERPREQAQALVSLGWSGLQMRRLGLPDGGLQAAQAEIAKALADVVEARDVLITPWRLDGHPDHEAVGHACAAIAAQRGARLIEVPVWGWNWARPDEPRWPWGRARRLSLDAETASRKQAAVQAFGSQIEADGSTGAPAVLDAQTLARARRPFELLFV